MGKEQMPVIVPPALKPGDTIGIAAPSGPVDRNAFEKGTAVLKEMGFRVYVPEGVFYKEDYLAGDDGHRATQLNRLFAESSIKGIICARGGFGAVRILDRLDLAVIRDNPKVFVGFSDITILLQMLRSRTGLVSFHGPTATTLGHADPETRQALLAATCLTKKLKITGTRMETIRSGAAVGPVVGGNLASLCHLLGTPYAPDFRGAILVLEDVGEAPYKIDRMITQMKLAGCFDELAGLALGEFRDSGQTDRIHAVIERALRGMTFPILAGFGIGHGSRNITLPIGLPATMDTGHHYLLYHHSATVTDG
jgi:muramoyltetrapeptide carboxypeptidase